MTTEEKARRYDEALERARYYHSKGYMLIDSAIENIFPELKESKDEKIRKIIHGWIYTRPASFFDNGVSKEEILTWLEKQGEQNLVDKVEPKFKVGDWVVWDNKISCHIDNIYQGKESLMYTITDAHNMTRSYSVKGFDNNAHLWTIADAKDGDVLTYVTDEEDLWIIIYWSLYEPYEGHVHYHALLVNDNFSDKGTCCICINDLKPATKKQRELLFQKMRESGYEWDSDKKELKKIEQHSEKPKWSEEDEKNWLGIMDEIEANKSSAPDYDIETYDRYLCWLESLKQRIL